MTLTSLRPGPSLETRQRAAEQVLRAAAPALRQKAGSTVDVDWSVQVGTGVEALLEESRTATMLVLQRRAVSALGRAHTGSTTGRTASRAVCPVAVVRAGHTHSADRSGIVVGLDPEGRAEGALQQAVVEAELLKEPLIVVEAWSDPRKATFDWVAYEPEELRARQERARLDLSESLAGLRSDHPDLEIGTEVVDGELTEGLLEASRTARLLVVNRRRTGHAGSLALGGVAWQCIRSADCPVLVTPPSVHYGHPHRRAFYTPTGPTY